MTKVRLLKSALATSARRVVTFYSYVRFGGRASLNRQIKRHSEHWHLDNAISVSHDLVPRLVKAGLSRDAHILVVGCCNMLEIYTFLSYGFRHVRGIDLVSHNFRYIKVMDMHDMRFADASFDAIYCAGAIHCTHAPKKLAAEFIRVLKPCGLLAISVPIKFKPDNFYIFDAGDAEGLRLVFGARTEDVVWTETILPMGPGNPNDNITLRSIFRLGCQPEV
jgi:SAM-dependent methyltransferase